MELKTTSKIVNLVTSAMKKEMETVTNQIIESQQFMSALFDDMLDQFKTLSEEVQALRRENTLLKKSLSNHDTKTSQLHDRVNRHELEADAHQRELLACNAIITGVKRMPNEDTADIVKKIFSALGCETSFKHVLSCTRINCYPSQPRNTPIKVVFQNTFAKKRIFEAKKDHGKLKLHTIFKEHTASSGIISIRSDLSPLSIQLLRELRKLQPTHKLQFVWPGLSGDILVKKTSASKAIAIKSRDDLQSFVSSLEL